MPEKVVYRDRMPIHTNGNMLCTVQIDKSGPNPGYHDLISICVLPIDSEYNPSLRVPPFWCDIRPKRPENIVDEPKQDRPTVSRERLCKIMVDGLEAYDAADRFEEWIKLLNLMPYKKIAPVTHGWINMVGFLIEWLGFESFNQFFHHQYRDLEIAAIYVNDKCDFMADSALYPRLDLTYLCNLTKVERPGTDLLQRCTAIAEVYKKMLRNRV